MSLTCVTKLLRPCDNDDSSTTFLVNRTHCLTDHDLTRLAGRMGQLSDKRLFEELKNAKIVSGQLALDAKYEKDLCRVRLGTNPTLPPPPPPPPPASPSLSLSSSRPPLPSDTMPKFLTTTASLSTMIAKRVTKVSKIFGQDLSTLPSLHKLLGVNRAISLLKQELKMRSTGLPLIKNESSSLDNCAATIALPLRASSTVDRCTVSSILSSSDNMSRSSSSADTPPLTDSTVLVSNLNAIDDKSSQGSRSSCRSTTLSSSFVNAESSSAPSILSNARVLRENINYQLPPSPSLLSASLSSSSSPPPPPPSNLQSDWLKRTVSSLFCCSLCIYRAQLRPNIDDSFSSSSSVVIQLQPLSSRLTSPIMSSTMITTTPPSPLLTSCLSSSCSPDTAIQISTAA